VKNIRQRLPRHVLLGEQSRHLADAIAGEMISSWTGQPAQTSTADQSERARLRKEQRRLEDQRQALIEREMELGQQLDDVYEDGFDEDDDDVDETVDVIQPLLDDQIDAAKQAYDEAVLAAMDPAQRQYFEQGA
jgi:hypothetical protein